MFKVGDRVVCPIAFWVQGPGTVVLDSTEPDMTVVEWDKCDYLSVGLKSSKCPMHTSILVLEEIYNSPLYKLLQEEK